MVLSLINFAKNFEKNWLIEEHSQRSLLFLKEFVVNKSLPEFEQEIAAWIESNEIPKQVNLYNNFGEPSLTIFNNGKFAVDIYFWRKNDTIVHSHGFRGAFKVLYGESLHEVFSVKTIESYSDDIKKTKLESKEINILKQGDSHYIDSSLTHRVVHLSDPTITLCVRTVEDINLDQWHHLPTGLSYKKKNLSKKTIKQILYFQYLLKSNLSSAELYLDKILAQLDTSSQISLYESLCYGEVGLDESSYSVAEKKFKLIFENKNWFRLYKKYYENLALNLQESNAESKELKLLAHSINSDYSKNKIKELLSQFSEESIEYHCQKLLENKMIFTAGLEEGQFLKVNQYL